MPKDRQMTDIVEIYNCANEPEARLLLALLAENGIEAKVVGEFLNGVGGEVPLSVHATPRIWANSVDRERARSVIAEWEKRSREPRADVIGWTCPKCDTDIERGFDVCWNCLYNPAAC